MNAEKLLGTDRELIFAIFIQNLLHTKNSHRTDAIKQGTYKELFSQADAREFIIQLMTKNFGAELLGIQSECNAKVAALQ